MRAVDAIELAFHHIRHQVKLLYVFQLRSEDRLALYVQSKPLIQILYGKLIAVVLCTDLTHFFRVKEVNLCGVVIPADMQQRAVTAGFNRVGMPYRAE